MSAGARSPRPTRSRPATGNGAASSRRGQSTWSFASSSTLRVEQLADLGNLVRRGLAGRQCLEHEFRGRSVEDAIEQIAHELLLCLVFRESGLVDVRPGGLVALDEPLLDHDLQRLENGGVRAL